MVTEIPAQAMGFPSAAGRAGRSVVSLLFGKDLPDPDRLLCGEGNQVRSMRLEDAADLDRPAVRALIAEAVRRSPAAFDPAAPGRLVIRSISAKRRPRRPR